MDSSNLVTPHNSWASEYLNHVPFKGQHHLPESKDEQKWRSEFETTLVENTSVTALQNRQGSSQSLDISKSWVEDFLPEKEMEKTFVEETKTQENR